MTRSMRLLRILAAAAAVALVMFVWSQNGPPRVSAVFYDNDHDGFRPIKGVFGLHYLQPTLDSLLDIFQHFFFGFSLRKTTRKSWDLSYKISSFIFFDHYM